MRTNFLSLIILQNLVFCNRFWQKCEQIFAFWNARVKGDRRTSIFHSHGYYICTNRLYGDRWSPLQEDIDIDPCSGGHCPPFLILHGYYICTNRLCGDRWSPLQEDIDIDRTDCVRPMVEILVQNSCNGGQCPPLQMWFYIFP